MTNREAAEAMREAARRAIDLMICEAEHGSSGPGRNALNAARDRVAALPLPADTSAPVPTPTDEEIIDAMIGAILNGHHTAEDAAYATFYRAKPLIREQCAEGDRADHSNEDQGR